MRGAAALVTYPDYSMARTQTNAARKVGPAMAGPTGPVPPAMNTYSENEATTFTITRTLGTGLLRLTGRCGHLYSAIATVIREGYEHGTYNTRASNTCTIVEPDFLASYQRKAKI